MTIQCYITVADDLFNDTTCSHGRAYNLLIEMIKKTKTNADKCSFRGYPCNDSETFHNGQCFECPKHGCPTPGLNMDVGTEYSGSYYFNTQNDETEEFCGKIVEVMCVHSKFLSHYLYYRPSLSHYV